MEELVIITVFVVYFLLFLVLPLLIARLLIFAVTKNSNWNPKRRWKWIWSVVLAAVWATYPWFNVVADIEGRVVDIHGQPIEGILVTARWYEVLRIPAISFESKGVYRTGLINAKEALTDKDGGFTIPGFFYVSRFMRKMQQPHGPKVRFFQKDLDFRVDRELSKHLRRKVFFNSGIYRQSTWDGLDVVMVEVDSDGWRRRDTEGQWGFIKDVFRDDSCLWANIPNAIAFTFNRRNPTRYPTATINGDIVWFAGAGEPKSMEDCGVDLSYFEVFKEWNVKYK